MDFSLERLRECHLPENEFAFAIMGDYLATMDIVEKAAARQLRDAYNITPLQYSLMFKIAERGKPLSNELAAAFGLGASTISASVSGLTSRGFVRRNDGPSDMRTVELSLTKKGLTLLGQAGEAVREAFSIFWGNLSADQFRAVAMGAVSGSRYRSGFEAAVDESRLNVALIDTALVSGRRVSSALKQHGLTKTASQVLLALRVMEQPCTSTGLAEFLFLNPADISSSLKTLESKGFVERSRQTANRRLRAICLTSAGRKRVTELTPVIVDALLTVGPATEELIHLYLTTAHDLVNRKRLHGDFQ